MLRPRRSADSAKRACATTHKAAASQTVRKRRPRDQTGRQHGAGDRGRHQALPRQRENRRIGPLLAAIAPQAGQDEHRDKPIKRRKYRQHRHPRQ